MGQKVAGLNPSAYKRIVPQNLLNIGVYKTTVYVRDVRIELYPFTQGVVN